MIWASSWAFFVLIPIIVIVLWDFNQRKNKTPKMPMSTLFIMRGLPKGARTYLSLFTRWLKYFSLVFMVVALARPQAVDKKVKKNVEGIDIVIALDVSDSMLIEDMRPENRLEASKKTIREFIEKRTSDRIGLVVFSGESYTRVPMTLDYPVLLQSLREVTTTKNIKMGTAIGVALANSVSRLKESTAKSRVIIFLTDGENNSGTIDPETALDVAKGYKVKIYSIGMGKDGQTQLPVYSVDSRGRKHKSYRPMYSKVNDELLGRMAKETGGKYYRATTTNALEYVFNDINRLEKTKIESNTYVKYRELFAPWLLAALVLYLTSFVMAQIIARKGV